MSKQSIKQTIDDNIYQNGQQRITGVVMNSVLNEMVDNEYGELGELTSKVNMFYDDKSNTIYFADGEGNVIAKMDSNGFHSSILNLDNVSGVPTFSFIRQDDGGTYLADKHGNVAMKISADGHFDVGAVGENLLDIIIKNGGGGGGQTGTTILDFNPKVEFENKINQLSPKSIFAYSNVKPFLIAFFSDIHEDYAEAKRIMQFCDYYSNKIDNVVCGGDIAANAYNQTTNFEQNWRTSNASKVLNVIGNHDTAEFANGSYNWSAHTGADAYARYIAPFISEWGVVHDGNTSHCYYYKDYTEQKLRMIVVDCMAYDDAQNAWLQNTMNGAKSKGFSVLAITHYPPKGISGFDCSFNTLHDTITNQSTILDARATASVNAFQQNGGSFVGWLCGHVHNDFVGTLTDYPNQVVIAIDTASTNNAQDQWSDHNRVIGTKSQDLFNLIGIDTDLKTIKVFRVGANYTEEGRLKDSMCIQYAPSRIGTITNPTLIYCS